MKKLISIGSVLIMALTAVAQAPQGGIKVWKASDLAGIGQKLGSRVDKQGLATETLANLEGNGVILVHRQADGEAEFHERAADFTIIQSGSATLVLGGEVKDGRNTGPGEIRGTSITGGQSYQVSAGDVIDIPAKTPHQVIVPKGGQVTYLVLKVPAK